MSLSRRELLAGALLVPGAGLALPEKIGVADASYGTRRGSPGEGEALREPVAFLTFCRERGAGGAQLPLRLRDEADAARLRRFLEESGLFLEGSVRLPGDASQVERFRGEVRLASAAGVTVLRTVLLGGRRYEAFATADEFRGFREAAARSVALAEPVAAGQRMRLAIENHKDLRCDELAELLRKTSSPWVGACVDTGNDLALLAEPTETVEALSPWAMSCHLKDMGVEEHPEGFLLSEVQFGQGFLDLKALVAALRKRRPEVRFHIEMITRDPLLVPCLTDRYWATMEGVSGRALARILTLVRQRRSPHTLPRTTGLTMEQKLKLEDENVQSCLAWARSRL
jgi:sugar phosphate isomerase/epimerase